MQNILTIFKKELAGYFNSAIAYIVIVVFLGITGWFFTSTLFIAGVVSMRSVFEVLPLLFVFFVPAITMRTISEEKKSGTIELLLTRPVTDMEIVVGKYLSALSLTVFALLPTVIYVIFLTFLGKVDMGSIFASYIGLIFMCGIYVGIGVFCSSLTENQIVSAVLSTVIIFALFMLNKVLVFLPASLASILEYMSIDYHFGSIARGVLDSRDLIYYISGILIMLFLTRTSLESRKW
jgi:ABC-2 type transport system permease protein